jgi:hypothetical protein
MKNKKRRSIGKTKLIGNISVSGNIKGIGNVVGHGESHVEINTHKPSIEYPSEGRDHLLWTRLIAFLIGLGGTLGLIAVFLHFIHDGADATIMEELILSAIVAGLGTAGFLKPELIGELLSRLFNKK